MSINIKMPEIRFKGIVYIEDLLLINFLTFV